MRTASAEAAVALAPEAALALWVDPDRWSTFVEGYGRELERSQDWPDKGGRVVWESVPGGRGRVTEKVVERATDSFATQVFEPALVGVQRLRVAEDAEGARVRLELEYQLQRYGPFNVVADALFIRRALRDALRRTLRRFSVEAEEEAGLR